MSITININGKDHRVDADGDTPLLWIIRDYLGLTGTKYGCGVAQCGACTVHVDGAPRRSCVAPVSSVVGKRVTTIEGVGGARADVVRRTWEELQVPQCGYCQSGQMMSAIALLERVEQPTDEDIDRAMSGNICRCATYLRIRQAVKKASGQEP